MTVKEVLQALRISRSTLNKLIKEKKILVAVRLGTRQDRRFNSAEIEKFIEGK